MGAVLGEAYASRAHLELGNLVEAGVHAQRARAWALKTDSLRARTHADVAEGAVLVHQGEADEGLLLLKRAHDTALASGLILQEVTAAYVRALDHVGRHGEALQLLGEQLDNQRRLSDQSVLQIVRQDLARIHGFPAQANLVDMGGMMRALEEHIEVLEGRVAKAELARQKLDLFNARIDALQQQAVLAELSDDSSGAHIYRVGRLAGLLAKAVGVEDAESSLIEVAARLHDVGKLGLLGSLPTRRPEISKSELAAWERHTEAGAALLLQSGIPGIELAATIARHHHERWDGTGYPAGLAGEAIPLPARVTAVADTFDALTHDRPYRPARNITDALSEIYAHSGTQFDPDVFRALLRTVESILQDGGDVEECLAHAAVESPFLVSRRALLTALRNVAS